MSKSKFNYKVYNGKTLKTYFENSRILLLTVFFVTGIITGAIILNKDSGITEKIFDFINKSVISKSGQGINEIFINSLLSNILFFAVNIFFAFSLIGYPLVMWLPFLKGLGLGAVIGYLYIYYGLTGLGYTVLTLVPGATVSVFALITACNSSCEYSKNAYSKAIIGKGQFEKGETKIFLIKQLIYICICAASSMTDALFSTIFLRFFEL